MAANSVTAEMYHDTYFTKFVSSTSQSNPHGTLFFSEENMINVQQFFRRAVLQESNGASDIGEYPITSLRTLARDFYANYMNGTVRWSPDYFTNTGLKISEMSDADVLADMDAKFVGIIADKMLGTINFHKRVIVYDTYRAAPYLGQDRPQKELLEPKSYRDYSMDHYNGATITWAEFVAKKKAERDLRGN